MGMKADAFKTDAQAAGWEAVVKTKGSIATVTAKRTRDGATLKISWDGEACLNETTIEIEGHIRKLRNAAAARRELNGETIMPKEGKKRDASAPRKPTTNGSNGSEPVYDDDKPQVPPPLWGMTNGCAPADDIVKKVKGKTITWINEKKRTVESATVLPNPDQRHLRVETSPVNRKRLLTFAARGEGFRSVYLERIVSVS